MSDPEKSAPLLCNAEEIAQRIGGGTTRRQVIDWSADGKFPRYVISARIIKFKWAEVEPALAKLRRNASR